MSKKIIWTIKLPDGTTEEVESIDGKMADNGGKLSWIKGQCVGSVKRWVELEEGKMTKLLPCN